MPDKVAYRRSLRPPQGIRGKAGWVRQTEDRLVRRSGARYEAGGAGTARDRRLSDKDQDGETRKGERKFEPTQPVPTRDGSDEIVLANASRKTSE